MPDAKKLARIHRVRSLQLTLSRAEESRAHGTAASERELSRRIRQLADGVAPDPEAGFAASLAAAAHYRERLQRSAETAENRVRQADGEAARASAAALTAKRDQSAVEKLMARADAARAVAELRALQDAPPTRKVRHDPC